MGCQDLNKVVDDDGIPSLIQQFIYLPGGGFFVGTLFNGATFRFCVYDVCKSVGLMQNSLHRMQYLEAINNIEKMVLSNWGYYKERSKI